MITCSLQLAGLVAHRIDVHVTRPNQTNRVFGAIQREVLG
jgi:hypothetical protein